jgi:hypothetical protein
MSVVTLETARAHLDAVAHTDDDEMQRMLDRAEAAITKRIGPLAATTVTSTVAARAGVTNYADSWDGMSLVLPVVPVISLTSLTGASGTVVDPSLLYVTGEGVVYFADGWSRFGEVRYTAIYQAGRAALPADLELAVLELLRHLWETQRGAANRPGGGALGEGLAPTLPGAVYTFPLRVSELLTPHVKVGF